MKLHHIKRLGLLLFSVLVFSYAFGQQDKPIKFDDTRKTNWPLAFEEVSIPSSADSAVQKAMLYRSKSKIAKPLIVSLHTWSGDYTQKDPLVQEIVARDWNYIHPDFRGPNRTPQSMGSPLVLSDIDDAIQFALQHTNADPEDVHIVGVSGGGFATLAVYMNTSIPVKSFSAWAPISDLEAWYWESVGRKQKYAKDILKAVSSTDTLDVAEVRHRSPLYQEFPYEAREGVPLYIYEGIHDG